MRQPGTRNRKTRGLVLLATLGFITFLVIFTALGTGMVQEQARRGVRFDLNSRAEYVARAGLQLALEQLFLDDEWASTTMPENVILDVSADGRLQARLTVYNNFSGTGTVAIGSKSLQPGSVHIESAAIVDGQEIQSSFGTANSFLVRPEVRFDHALYDNDESLGQQAGDAWVDAYDSDLEELRDVYQWQTGQPVQPPTTAPYGGRGGASLRSNGQVGSGIAIYGDMHLPSSSEYLTRGTGVVFGNIIRNDSPQIPMVFKTPPSLASAAVTPLDLSGPLLPGRYGDVSIPAGTRVVMARGEYSFSNLTLGEGCEIVLEDDPVPPYDPVIVYLEEELVAERDLLVNMQAEFPAARQAQAAEFQIYGTDGPGRASTIVEFKDGSRIRGVLAGYALRVRHRDGTFTGLSPATLPGSAPSGRQGVDFFGGLYAQGLGHEPGVRYHQDKALSRRVMEAKAQWVLLDQGNLKRGR